MPPYSCVPIKSCRSDLKNVVYLIVSTRGKKYVGITTRTLKHRMGQHREAIRAGHGDGQKFIDYYRRNNFEKATVQVLYKPRGGKVSQKLRQKEVEYIQEYDSMRNGLNSKL
uniref:GIY-YIG domain-containing protein n=1 Tax=Amphimedon queenslandica TaxID=400682 RepID=A0A1X7VTS6_AMPQE